MPERAEERLARLLYVLAAAGREGGASLSGLAAELEVPPQTIVEDLEEATARAYYHPAGSADDFRVFIEHDRVRVWSGGEFLRPARLSPREAMTLAIGLRMLAADADPPRRVELIRLAADLETRLAALPAETEGVAGREEVSAAERPTEQAERIRLEDGESGEGGIRALLFAAARDRVTCRVRYLKPGAAEPEERTIDPYAIARADGHWYALSWCHTSRGVRAFRVDRVLWAAPTGESFEVPRDFDPASYLTGRHVYRAGDEVTARIRYSARIARWLEERGEGEPQADGGVIATRRVADPRWIVRHVLQYGPDAELLEPVELRAAVLEALERHLAVEEAPEEERARA